MVKKAEAQKAKNKRKQKFKESKSEASKSILRRHQSSLYSQPEGSRGTSTTPHMGTHPVVFQGQNGPVTPFIMNVIIEALSYHTTRLSSYQLACQVTRPLTHEQP